MSSKASKAVASFIVVASLVLMGGRPFAAPQVGPLDLSESLNHVPSIGAMDQWVRTGVRPTAAQFPTVLGFVPNFVAPAFPQP